MTTPIMQLLAWADRQGPKVRRDLSFSVVIAQQAYRGQFRRSGDPYIEHPIAVALLLADHGADPETVITAVLHDIDLTCSVLPVQALREEFGETIVELLAEFTELERSAVVDITQIDVTTPIRQRAIQIKIADRLHNMQTIRYVDPTKQRRKSAHTREVVVPLAHILGLYEFGAELDELASATLRAYDTTALSRRAQRGTRNTLGIRQLRGALHAGGLLLPTQCRHRWLQEWDGELHAAESLTERCRFATSVLRSMPSLAISTRRRR